MSIDYTLDQWSTWLQTKIITYSLVSWHWITLLYANASDFTWKTVRGICDAHTPEQWYFPARNECPWPLKDTETTNNFFLMEAMWVPTMQRMYFRENYRDGNENTIHSFNDVVTAELYNADKSVQYELSSFFHTFSWRSVRAAPSLYEVVLIYCLSNNLLLRKSQLEGFTLEVMTAEGEIIKQRLDSTRSYSFFDTWESYREVEGELDTDSTSVDSE
jgi:hypothetical protein